MKRKFQGLSERTTVELENFVENLEGFFIENKKKNELIDKLNEMVEISCVQLSCRLWQFIITPIGIDFCVTRIPIMKDVYARQTQYLIFYVWLTTFRKGVGYILKS